MDQFDIIVIGGGSGGSAAAGRLAEDGSRRVCLIEAGGRNDTIRVKTPGFPIRFSKTPSKVDRGAPLVGEHTRAVLHEAGYPDAEIERLIAEGAVAAS